MVGVVDVDTLSRSVVLRGLPRDELESIVTKLRRRTYRRGEVICHEGDPGQALYVVCSGSLKVTLSGETGEEAILNVVGPGDVVGEMALLDGAPRSATITALEPVELAALNRDDFLALLHRSPTAVEGVLHSLAQTIRRLSEEVGGLMFLDLHARLAKKLLELAESHGRTDGGEVSIEVPLTQEELAGMIGATRPRVNKLLGHYEDRGAIARRGRHIVIRQPALLRRWSSG
jgi:CRP/FNR family transcriptional regulator, cyclic AMP receptor protein